MPGRFVSIEGIDASGKSTLVAGLVRRLRDRGIDAVSIVKKQDEGYGHPFVDRLAHHLKAMLWDATPEDPVGMVAEYQWTLMHTLWYELQQEHLLAPLLRQHDVVVTDGWYYKFLARHMVHAPEQAERTRVVLGTVREADIVLFLDVTPEECWSRRPAFRPSEVGAHAQVDGASEREKFLTYQGRVYDQFRALASRGAAWRVVEAIGRTPDEIAGAMAEEVVRP